MYEYPPPQWTTWGMVSAFAVPLTIFAVVSYWLLRRKRTALAVDPLLWCVLATPVVIAVLTVNYGYVMAPNPSDAAAVLWLNGTVTLLAAIGLFFVFANASVRSQSLPGALGSTLLGAFGSLLVLDFYFPALATPPPVSWRSQCKNNLKAIGLAFHSYHDEHDAFPAAAAGAPPVSWRVTLLPFLEHQGLFKRYDQSAAWDAPVNTPLMSEFVRELTCPAMWNERRRAGERVPTSYVAPTGPGTLFAGPDPPTFRTMSDGASNTILVLEACSANIVWSEPRDIDVAGRPPGVNLPGSQPGASEGVFSSLHAGMAQVVLGDGSVREVRNKTDPAVLKRLFDPDDGEPLGEW